MPNPLARIAIKAVHSQFYSCNYPQAVQVFSGGFRLMNSEGDNPAVIEIKPEDKVLLGLTETVAAYRVSVLGRGDPTVDHLVSPSASWTLSFDNGQTQQSYVLANSISPDPSMECWKFVLYRALSGG